jgi:hypothetical protein
MLLQGTLLQGTLLQGTLLQGTLLQGTLPQGTLLQRIANQLGDLHSQLKARGLRYPQNDSRGCEPAGQWVCDEQVDVHGWHDFLNV